MVNHAEGSIDAIAEATLSIEAQAAQIRAAASWACDRCGDFGVPSPAIERLDLCISEALANVVAHGSETARSRPIEIFLRLSRRSHEGRAELEIRDAGVAFDPASYAPSKIGSSLADSEIGGLGVTLICHNTDTLSYARLGGINALKLGFVWPRLGDDDPV